jgi:hypothetical protein
MHVKAIAKGNSKMGRKRRKLKRRRRLKRIRKTKI